MGVCALWQGALPIFRPGHRQRIAALVARMPRGLELAGSFLGGVSMPDRAIAAGRMVDSPK